MLVVCGKKEYKSNVGTNIDKWDLESKGVLGNSAGNKKGGNCTEIHELGSDFMGVRQDGRECAWRIGLLPIGGVSW